LGGERLTEQERMARARRRGRTDDTPPVRVKALKLKGRKHYILRWTDPATGKQREEATEILSLDRNRRKALRAAAEREAELQDRLDAGVPLAPAPKPKGVTVRILVDRHLEWAKANRSLALHSQRKSLLAGFCSYVVTDHLAGAGECIESLLAPVVDRPHVEQYLASRTTERRPLVIAVKATWNWAAANGLLPHSHRPFADLPRGGAAVRDLSEADLPTPKEVESIFRWAAVETSKVRAGTGRWRKRQPDEYFDSPEAKTFADMLRVYHATGARTGELCDAVVRDFMPSTKQLCLGKHKRTTTQRNPTVRNIQLGDDALAAVVRHVGSRAPDAPLFTRRDGTAWNQNDVNRRFRGVRKIAKEREQPIRAHITPYSFRHLYISELLMIGTPIFQVAKMAGTSSHEIERTYGHFFNRDLADAQRKLDRRRAKAKGEVKGGKRPKSSDR
jgi:integrase